MNNPLIKNYQNNFRIKFWQDLYLENEPNDLLLELIEYISAQIVGDLYIIFNTLKKYNYVFDNLESAFCFQQNSIINIHYLSDYFINQGKLPLLFCKIYEKIDSVDFRGNFENSNFEILLDPIVLFSIKDIIECNNIDYDLLRFSEEKIPYIGFSPNELAKEDISSSGYFYGVELQKNKKNDSYLVNYDDDENTFFIEYLRKVIFYGGFPNLEFINFKDLDVNFKEYLIEIRSQIKTKF